MIKLTIRISLQLIITVLFLVATFSRNQIWQNTVSLWTDVSNRPSKGRSFQTLGQYYATHGDYEKAIVNFLEAINRAPRMPVIYYDLAHAYEDIGDLEKAIWTFKCALAASLVADGFDTARIHKGLGEIYFKNLELSKARGEFETVIALEPNNSNAHYKLGLIYRANEDYRASSSQILQAIALDPQNKLYKQQLKEIFFLEKRRGK